MYDTSIEPNNNNKVQTKTKELNMAKRFTIERTNDLVNPYKVTRIHDNKTFGLHGNYKDAVKQCAKLVKFWEKIK